MNEWWICGRQLQAVASLAGQWQSHAGKCQVLPAHMEEHQWAVGSNRVVVATIRKRLGR